MKTQPYRRDATLPDINTTAIPQLDEQIGFQLRLAQLAVFSDIIEALKPLDLRPVDFSALLLIEAQPGLRQHVIGDYLKIARPNLVPLVDSLVKRKLIERVVDPLDRRANLLELTEAGSSLLVKAKRAQDEHRARLMEALGDIALEPFMAALTRLAQLGRVDA
jgi:DNA-binding MarR family transcriptional regulator